MNYSLLIFLTLLAKKKYINLEESEIFHFVDKIYEIYEGSPNLISIISSFLYKYIYK